MPPRKGRSEGGSSSAGSVSVAPEADLVEEKPSPAEELDPTKPPKPEKESE